MGALLATATSSVVAIYTAVKTPSTASSVNSYETLKKELEAQRADIQLIYKSTAEERVWLEEWRRSEIAKSTEEMKSQQTSIEYLIRSSPPAAGHSSKPSAAIMFSVPENLTDAKKPDASVPLAPAYKDRPGLPSGKSLF